MLEHGTLGFAGGSGTSRRWSFLNLVRIGIHKSIPIGIIALQNLARIDTTALGTIQQYLIGQTIGNDGSSVAIGDMVLITTTNAISVAAATATTTAVVVPSLVVTGAGTADTGNNIPKAVAVQISIRLATEFTKTTDIVGIVDALIAAAFAFGAFVSSSIDKNRYGGDGDGNNAKGGCSTSLSHLWFCERVSDSTEVVR